MGYPGTRREMSVRILIKIFILGLRMSNVRLARCPQEAHYVYNVASGDVDVYGPLWPLMLRGLFYRVTLTPRQTVEDGTSDCR